MEALVWETAEELDKKVAEHLRNIRKRRQISQRSLAISAVLVMALSNDLKQQDRFPYYR